MKRKLSNNVEELVITREKVDSNGTDDTPDIPIRSPSLCSDVESEDTSEHAKSSTENNSQFVLPFSSQVVVMPNYYFLSTSI